jgi:hypothetical protein
VIDLEDITNLCPGLREESAGPLAFRAIVALQRRHRPGVNLTGTVRGESVLFWSSHGA